MGATYALLVPLVEDLVPAGRVLFPFEDPSYKDLAQVLVYQVQKYKVRSGLLHGQTCDPTLCTT